MMRKALLTTFTVGLILVLILTNQSHVYTNSAQPPAGRTGAPGELTCASAGCHADATVVDNSADVSLTTPIGNDISSGYTPGTKYNLILDGNITGFGGTKWGFEMTAEDASGNAAGTFALVGAATSTSLQTLGGKQYVGHKTANATKAWSFEWTAPATDVGPISFYIAVNAANNDNVATGDEIRFKAYQATTSAFAPLTTTVGINDVISADVAPEVSIFPNPVAERLNISFDLTESAEVTAELFNIQGQQVQFLINEEATAGTYQRSFNVEQELTPGYYVVRLSLNEQAYYKKILVE